MKNILHTTLFLSLLTILASCDQQTETIDSTIDPEYGGLTKQLAAFYDSTGPARQVFKINTQRDTIIVGKKGTTLFVPANSLVDKNGQQIKDESTIELKEFLEYSDFILSSLQTVSDDKMLVTNGMIYFQAKSPSHKVVMIDPKKPIRIEIPTNEKLNSNNKIFKGTRDAKGNMNWTEPRETDKKLIPVPIKSIKPMFPTECPLNFGITNNDSIWSLQHHDYLYLFDDINKYENTLIATREFGQRFYGCCCWEEVIKTYISNLDKNMWEIDEMMVEYYIKDSIERVNYYLNNISPGPNGGKRTKEQEEARQWLIDHSKEGSHRNIEVFRDFASQKLTKIDTTRILDTTSVKNYFKAIYAFEALEFGWINVDYFYEEPNAEPIQLFVQAGQVKPTILNLIFPSLNIILSATEMRDGRFRFTKNEDGYNKLPKGENAFIVGITYLDNKLYFVKSDITIGERTNENIELVETTVDEFEKEIKRITAPNNGEHEEPL